MLFQISLNVCNIVVTELWRLILVFYSSAWDGIDNYTRHRQMTIYKVGNCISIVCFSIYTSGMCGEIKWKRGVANPTVLESTSTASHFFKYFICSLWNLAASFTAWCHGNVVCCSKRRLPSSLFYRSAKPRSTCWSKPWKLPLRRMAMRCCTAFAGALTALDSWCKLCIP